MILVQGETYEPLILKLSCSPSFNATMVFLKLRYEHKNAVLVI